MGTGWRRVGVKLGFPDVVTCCITFWSSHLIRLHLWGWWGLSFPCTALTITNINPSVQTFTCNGWKGGPALPLSRVFQGFGQSILFLLFKWEGKPWGGLNPVLLGLTDQLRRWFNNLSPHISTSLPPPLPALLLRAARVTIFPAAVVFFRGTSFPFVCSWIVSFLIFVLHLPRSTPHSSHCPSANYLDYFSSYWTGFVGMKTISFRVDALSKDVPPFLRVLYNFSNCYSYP